MAAISPFHAEKCCRLVSRHEASTGAYAAAFRQKLAEPLRHEGTAVLASPVLGTHRLDGFNFQIKTQES